MENTLWLYGQPYHLSPSLERISRIEQILSISIFELAKRLSVGVITSHELFIIVQNCLVLEGKELDIKAGFFDCGLTKITEAVTSMFISLFAGANSGHEDFSELRQMIEKNSFT